MAQKESLFDLGTKSSIDTKTKLGKWLDPFIQAVIVGTCAVCLLVAVVQSAITSREPIFRDIWHAIGDLFADVLLGHKPRRKERQKPRGQDHEDTDASTSS